MTRVYLKNARVFDATGAAPYPATVEIAEGRIAAVHRGAGPDATPPPAPDARVLDCAGHTVMPGLTEAHTHISFDDLHSMYDAVATQPEDHALIALANAQRLLERGFTSLFSAAAAKPRLDVAVRDAIAAGRFTGPRIRAASQEITPSGNLGDLDTGYLTLPRTMAFVVTCDGPDEFTKAARLAARDGVDTVKINISGDRDWGHMHADDTVTVITEAEIAAVVSVARARGMKVAAHCNSRTGVAMAVSQGVDVIYHAVHADADARARVAEAADRVFVAPAIGLPISMLEAAEAGDFPADAAKRDRLKREVETAAACMADLHRRGVRVLPGGDYGAVYTNPIGTNARDLAHFVDLIGIPALDTLVAATRHGAALMGRAEDLGQVKPGFVADLLIVAGDPLDDVAILQDPDRIAAVILEGRFVRDTLAAPSGAEQPAPLPLTA
ncbi:MAG: amidohydrolase family protein [Azospirillaceae bacterium]